MTPQEQRARSERVIAESERLVQELDQALERGRQVLARRGVDPETVRKRLAAMTPAARERVRREVERLKAAGAAGARAAAAPASPVPATRTRPLMRVRRLV